MNLLVFNFDMKNENALSVQYPVCCIPYKIKCVMFKSIEIYFSMQ